MTLASSNLSPDIMANMRKPSKITANVLLQKIADEHAKSIQNEEQHVLVEEKPTTPPTTTYQQHDTELSE